MATPSLKSDLVLHEGIILGHPLSDSIAIGAGRILAHGPFSDLKALVGPRTHLLKLGGRTVAPGLIDSHLHYLEAAAAVTGLALYRCRSIGDLLADLRLAAGRKPPGNWIRAFGCDESLLGEKRGPTRAELDQGVPKNPLRLRHQTLHASWLNSRAIALLGLEAPGFEPPAGANLLRDVSGKLTGFVVGMEEWLAEHLPRVTKAETESRARSLSREMAAAGVTAFTDATARNDTEDIALFARLALSGAICQRIGVMIGAAHLQSASEAAQAAPAAGVGVVAAKFMLSANSDSTDLLRSVKLAVELGLDCAFHVTEVEELELALATIEVAKVAYTGALDAMPAFRIEHGATIPPNYIDRIFALGVWVVTNPGFIHYRGVKYLQEPGLIPHLYRARSLSRAGVKLAGATDAPVTPAKPLAAIAAAVSRTTVEGVQLAPEEALGTEQAFTLFTRNAARLMRLDAGDLEPGRLADLVVLPKDPFALRPSEIANLAVDLTIVDGRVVYERGRPAIASSDSADLQTP